jgi:hypothetical protein
VSGRSERFHYGPQEREPSEVLINAPGLVVNKAGSGPETCLIVKRRPPCRDSDPAWQRLLAYVRERRLVQLEDRPYVPGQTYQNLIYMTPEKRKWAYDNPDMLRQLQQQLEAMRRHGDFR